MNRTHLFILIGINALWGFNFIAGKYGTAAFGPLLFISLRFALVLLLLSVFIRWVPGQMRRIMAIGLLMGIGHYVCMFYGIFLAGSLSAVAITSQLTVPFATILAIIFLKEKIGLTRALAITASFMGVVIIGFEPIGPDHTVALFYTAIASLAMATSTILMRQLQGVAVFNLQAWIALCATISTSLVTWYFENPSLSFIQSIPLGDYWWVAYSAIAATIIGHGLLFFLLQRYPINNIAPFFPLSTLFAIAFGVLLISDALTLKIIVGGALTLFGVTIVAIRNAMQETTAKIHYD